MMELKYLTNNLFDQGRESKILTYSFAASKTLSEKAIWGCNQAGIDPNDLYEKQIADF